MRSFRPDGEQLNSEGEQIPIRDTNQVAERGSESNAKPAHRDIPKVCGIKQSQTSPSTLNKKDTKSLNHQSTLCKMLFSNLEWQGYFSGLI